MGFPYKIVLLLLMLNNLQFTHCQQPNSLFDFPLNLTKIKHFPEFVKSSFSLQNIAKTAIYVIGRRLFKLPKKISKVCAKDVRTAFSEILYPNISSNIMTNWPVKMLDSFGKPPSGITTGNIYWLGSFQQCIDVVSPFNASSNKFIGEYCLADLYPKQILLQDFAHLTAGLNISLKIGLCFPSTCSLHDKSLLLNNTLKFAKKYVRSEITKENCQTKQAQPMDSTTIVLICVLSTFAMLVLTSTLLELGCHLKNQNTDTLDRSGLGIRLFASFSAIRSLKAIFKTDMESSDLRIIHGIRALSILWIIFGHVSRFCIRIYPWRNQLEVYRVFDYFLLQPFLFNALYGVTSFFVLSGFLVTYLFIQRSTDRRRCPNIFGYYIFRYIRLTPPLLLLILFLAGPFYYTNNGPIWSSIYEVNLKQCRRMGWMSILYIQNFVSFDESCFTLGWYLSADTQLYILAPIILYPLYIKPYLGMILMGVMFSGTTIAALTHVSLTGQSTYFGKHVTYADQMHFLDDLYSQAYYNAPSYLIGMTAGYLLFYMQNNRIVLLKKIVIPCWICAIAMVLAIMYGTYPYFNGSSDMGPWMNVVYGVFGRQAWALAVSWVIIACALGYKGPINWLLTQTPFVIVGRLTYCAYLVHEAVVEYYYYGQKDNLQFNFYNMFMLFNANVAVTMIAAVVLAVLIEMPVVEALKQLRNKYDKYDPVIMQLTFDPTHLKNTSQTHKLMTEISSQEDNDD